LDVEHGRCPSILLNRPLETPPTYRRLQQAGPAVLPPQGTEKGNNADDQVVEALAAAASRA
ncbi:MAG: hypothetical protein DIU63_08275, partial [Proteobacteria bacterium]